MKFTHHAIYPVKVSESLVLAYFVYLRSPSPPSKFRMLYHPEPEALRSLAARWTRGNHKPTFCLCRFACPTLCHGSVVTLVWPFARAVLSQNWTPLLPPYARSLVIPSGIAAHSGLTPYAVLDPSQLPLLKPLPCDSSLIKCSKRAACKFALWDLVFPMLDYQGLGRVKAFGPPLFPRASLPHSRCPGCMC